MDNVLEQVLIMFVNCKKCGQKANINGKPKSMAVETEKESMFTLYYHCSHCGASTKVSVVLTLARDAFTQADLFST